MSDISHECTKPGCYYCYEVNRNKVKQYRRDNWTDWDTEYLKRHYKVIETVKISEFLNRSPSSIYSRVYEINNELLKTG